MQFDITISVGHYMTKPSNEEIKKIEYIKKNLSLKDITNCIKNGFVLSTNFTEDYTSTIKQHQRTYKNLIGTHLIMLDLDDDIKCDLEELVSIMKIKPTIAYTTYSHQQKGKGNRYRLLFFFQEEIVNVDTFKELYSKIVEINEFTISDNCGRNCTQAIFGSHSECELINTDIIYSIDQFNLKNENGHSNSIKKEERNNIGVECPIQDEKYILDFWNMSYMDLLSTYNDKYFFFEHTRLPEVDNDTPYIILPNDYIEIKRYYFFYINYDEHGKERSRTLLPRKIKDGERRKRKLFFNGILRRLMIKELPFEHLLHCLIHELVYYVNNTWDTITKKTLYQIAVSAYSADLSKYQNLAVKTDGKKYIVNEAYCTKNNLNKRQVSNISRKMITYNLIGELYDFSLTDKANIEVFKEYGLKICAKTLQRFRKEMGITKYNKTNGHSDFIKKEERNNIEIESPIQDDMDKPYYDYQSELLLNDMDENVNDGFYDLSDTDDIKAMLKTFVRKAKGVNPNYENAELVEMFKEHYSLAS